MLTGYILRVVGLFCYHYRMNADRLVAEIKNTAVGKGSLVFIAISGFGGSGKSTLAQVLQQRLEGAEVVSIDDFIIGPKEQRSTDWHTFDRGRLEREILKSAQTNHALRYQQFQSGVWASKQSGTWRTIYPRNYIIIEGCSVLHPSLMKYYDLSVWINCLPELALDRAKQRDRSEGNNQDKLWDEVWAPNDLNYFNIYHPDRLADVNYNID